jgi:NDP-sugar pyrophosphorylase family protein
MPLSADKSILENVLEGVARAGISHVTITLGYLGHLIEAVVGSGENYGVLVTYTREDMPMGTAGPLGLLDAVSPTDRLLIINGDTFTDLDYRRVLDPLHGDVEAVVTCVSRDLPTNYGVVAVDHSGNLATWDEKPVLSLTVSTGIYGLKGSALDLLPSGSAMDMPQLLMALKDAGRPVRCLLADCQWKDLGRPEDFAELQKQFGDMD